MPAMFFVDAPYRGHRLGEQSAVCGKDGVLLREYALRAVAPARFAAMGRSYRASVRQQAGHG
ncbi:hypothetical protein FQZ97_836050 [compost metagenome]